MSSQFSTPNYVSPSMSPIPSQMNPFAQFQQKASSPKLQSLYNSPQGSFDGLDPAAMMSFTQQLSKPAQSAMTQQQLFYQRMMPGTEMYYKIKHTDNILLQSDMSKHVDAKPFNPGASPHPGQHPGVGPHPGHPGIAHAGHAAQMAHLQQQQQQQQVPRPGIFKPGEFAVSTIYSYLPWLCIAFCKWFHLNHNRLVRSVIRAGDRKVSYITL